MIFVSLGTQKFQLNRLLSEIDELIEDGVINEPVFAQIGNSTYLPRNFEYKNFLSQHDFHIKINECDVLITHGGVGSIQNGLKLNKKVIVYPRLSKYGEHVDDHQTEIAEKYDQYGYCLSVSETKSLRDCLRLIPTFKSAYTGYDTFAQMLDCIRSYIADVSKK